MIENLTFTDSRNKRSPDKYDDNYSKFLQRHFHGSNQKYLDNTDEYKQAQQENDDSENDGGSTEDHNEGGGDDSDSGYEYAGGSSDYERIKALSEKQVEELHKKPGNCKQFKKDGMICSTCEDPDTGDTSESCAYSSEPDDKKVAFLMKKSHNYKTKPSEQVEIEEPATDDEDVEDQEELAINPPPKDSKPLKHKTESEDADYGAYKLADDNSDVDDYDAPKFAHIRVEPKLKKDFEIIPQSQFKSRNLNQALTDFKTKDWSKCKKIMKGDMTCYYCKNENGATQEECMFVSGSNPKSFKVERHETKSYGDNKKPILPTMGTTIVNSTPATDKHEKFARLRNGRPLMPTKSSALKKTVEPLITPKPELNPNNDYFNSRNKKTIKRTISVVKKVSENDFEPAESRAIFFESHVSHD